MNRTVRWILIVVAVAASGAGGYWIGHRGMGESAVAGAAASTQPSEEPDEEKPVATVKTAPLNTDHISDTITVYGTVVAEARDLRSLSVPFEARVARVRVTPGQRVSADTPVVELVSSPDALLALQEASNALDVASRDLKLTEQRFAAHLGTNGELSQAQQAVQSATLRRDSLVQRGVGESRTLLAELNGVVSKVDVQEGQIVAAGAAMVEIAARNRIAARLGVEPSDATALRVGQAVRLFSLDRSTTEPIPATITTINQQIDPTSRLVNVLASLPENSDLLLDSFVSARVERAAADGFVVPRGALVPSEDGDTFQLYTVKDGHAVKHDVRLGLQNQQSIQVIADDLKQGAPVVIEGNYQLEDGMDVTEEHDQAGPASSTSPTAPATQEIQQ